MFAFLFSLIVFCVTFDSSASATGTTKTLTPSETRALIGDTISAQYYDGSDMVEFTFSYGGSTTLSSPFVDGSPSLTFAAGDAVIWYSAQVSPNTNPQYITVDVCPRYSFFDTEVIQQMCGLTTDLIPGVSAYSPPSWRWHTSYSGDLIIENQLTANTYYYAICDVSINGSNKHFTFIDADFSQQSTFSAYSDRALFYGNSAVNGWVYFVVTCPVVSSDSTMASGTNIGTGTGVGDITVNVDVDMSETNGLLGTIANLISGLVDGIVSIFIPDEDFLLHWLDDMHDMLREHFGSFVDAMTIIDDVFDAVHGDTATGTGAGMSNVSVTSATIGLPSDITVPFYGGVSFKFESSDWQMPLVPAGFSGILGLFVDFQKIIYLIMFINMINNKLHHYLSPQDGT